jgi:hypothetical protein
VSDRTLTRAQRLRRRRTRRRWSVAAVAAVIGVALVLWGVTSLGSSSGKAGARDSATTTQPATRPGAAGPSTLHVIGITSAGSQPGTAEIGSTFTVTFDHPLDPATVDTAAGASAITFCKADRTSSPTCAATGPRNTQVVIKGLTSAAGFVTAGGAGFVTRGGHATAPGTLRLTNDDKTVSFTITGPFRGSGRIQNAPAPVSFRFTPLPTIADASGNRATNPFRQPAIQLF